MFEMFILKKLLKDKFKLMAEAKLLKSREYNTNILSHDPIHILPTPNSKSSEIPLLTRAKHLIKKKWKLLLKNRFATLPLFKALVSPKAKRVRSANNR